MIHSVDIHVNTFFRKNVLMTPTLPIADRWPMGGGLTFEQTAAHRVYENKELRRRILSGKVAKLAVCGKQNNEFAFDCGALGYSAWGPAFQRVQPVGRRPRAGLPAPQNRQNFGRTTLVL